MYRRRCYLLMIFLKADINRNRWIRPARTAVFDIIKHASYPTCFPNVPTDLSHIPQRIFHSTEFRNYSCASITTTPCSHTHGSSFQPPPAPPPPAAKSHNIPPPLEPSGGRPKDAQRWTDNVVYISGYSPTLERRRPPGEPAAPAPAPATAEVHDMTAAYRTLPSKQKRLQQFYAAASSADVGSYAPSAGKEKTGTGQTAGPGGNAFSKYSWSVAQLY